MILKLPYVLATFSLFLIVSCNVGPHEIDYGHEGCQYCKMTIVDDRYAAQIVTNTGKAYSFDAVECMIRFRESAPFEGQEAKLLLVTDYSSPGQLTDANASIFVRSKGLPSPMGMYLTGVKDPVTAAELLQHHPGDRYSWAQLLEVFHQLPSL